MIPTSLKLASILLAFAFLASATVPGAPLESTPPGTLTSTAQLHHLPPSVAARHPYAVVEGIVTGLMLKPYGFTVQDGNDGIFVALRSAHTVVRIGQKVRIWGTGNTGVSGSILMADRVEILGYSALPRPRRLRAVELDGEVLDNQYVEVRGVVRAANMSSDGERSFGIIKVDMQPGSVRLVAPDFGGNPEKFVDSVIRAHGVAQVEFNQRGQALGLQVGVANIRNITIERTAPADPFNQPVTPIGSLMMLETGRDWSRRQRIRGSVTLQRPGEFAVLQNEDRAIRVETRTRETLPRGTLLDAAGFVATEAYSPVLKDAVIRRQAIVAGPLSRPAVDLLAGGSDWLLVKTAGTLVESGQSSTGLTLLLEDHQTRFSAELRDAGVEQLKVLPGSRIEVTGVCELLSNSLGAPEGFRLLLRSVSDIKVLKNAPTLMSGGFPVWAGVGFAILAILSALWALILRRRVHQDNNWITASLNRQRAAASHDALTGVANRRHFEHSLAIALSHAAITGGEVALFSIDLGELKRFNGTIGRSAGDLLLKQVAHRLGAVLDSTQLLSRIGDDEFTVIQPVEAGSRSPEELAVRLMNSFGGEFVTAGTRIQVGASIGISRYPMDGENGDQLLRNADAAMYHAKRNGRGVYFFDLTMREVMMRKFEIRRQLPYALERGEFFAHFQPIEELSNGSIVCFEALCRWTNPQLGSVPPDEFIGIAEETGQINEIGKWMLHEACLQGLRWQLNERSPVRVAVNVSAVQFAAEGFVETVAGVLAATGFPPRLLELEITESVLVSEPEQSVRKMLRLRGMGIGLSIDDFGTGYSSLSYLQNLPVDSFKIDRSFIAKVESNPSAVTMIQSMIAMGHTLGLRVVTEGVESADQLEITRQLGSDEVQGLYIGEPASAEAALQAVVQTYSRRPSVQPLQMVVRAAPAA